MPNWVPAPAKTSPKEQIKSSSKSSQKSRRQSYPLCLVCEYDHDDAEDESIHQLYEKFQKGAVQLEQLDNEVRSKTKNQKAKVLDALWKMDIDSRKKIVQELNENKVG